MTFLNVDELLTESVGNLFSSICTFDAVQAAEETGWSDEIWTAVNDAGFTRIGLPESQGGSGGALTDAAEVLRLAGAHAAPVPLAETAMLGGWLLCAADLPLPDGAVTIIPGSASDTLAGSIDGDNLRLTGTASRVPWAARSDLIAGLIVVEDQTFAVAIAPQDVAIEPMTNLAGEPRETITVDLTLSADSYRAVETTIATELRLRGALSRAMMMAGALEAMSDLTISYTAERSQFGRPIGRFQAVQQHLVWGAQDAALTKMTAQVASIHASDDVIGARFQIAAARQLADESAGTATRWAHQAHGAMGMTQEYALHQLSRRLWAWRHEFSVPGEWASTVGQIAESAGPEGLYPLIAS